MNKNLIFAIALIFFIASCTITQKRSKDIDVFVGKEGLVPEFIKNSPPEKVFEDKLFPVSIKIKNNGAYSIKENEKAVLSLGVEKDYTKTVTLLRGGRIASIDNLNNAAAFSLDGKSSINPIGDEEVVSFNLQAGTIDPQSETHTSAVIANLCYPYETVLDTAACIDADINNLRVAKKVCEMKDLMFTNGQGAPVAVTKVEVNMLPTLEQAKQNEKEQTKQTEKPEKIVPQFLIYIENIGQGTVIRSESVNEFCTKSDTSHSNLNVVYVNVYLSGKELECQLDVRPSVNERGHIKLKDKKDIIRCALERGIETSQNAYISPLKVSLKYGYTQSITAIYTIQKPVR